MIRKNDLINTCDNEADSIERKINQRNQEADFSYQNKRMNIF